MMDTRKAVKHRWTLRIEHRVQTGGRQLSNSKSNMALSDLELGTTIKKYCRCIWVVSM